MPTEHAPSLSEERLRLLVEATRAGVWDTHLGTGETFVNERFEEIMGYAPGFCPRSFTESMRRVVPDHRERVLDLMRQSVATGEPFVADCRIVDARDVSRWLHVRGSVLTDARGKAERLIGVLVDTTEEVEARQRREAQDRFLAGVNAALPLVVFAFDLLEQQLLFANRTFAEALGYAEGEIGALLAGNLFAIMHPEDVPSVMAFRARLAALGEGEVETVIVRVQHRDGHWRWFRARGTPLRRLPDGALWQVAGTAEDVTEQMLAEERLRAQERELARAQELAQVGSWTWHFKTEQLSWSREMYRVVELDPATVSPSEAVLDSRIRPEDRERLRAAHTACVLHGTPVDERVVLQLPEGRQRHVHVLAEVLRAPDGTPQALVGTMQDISDDVARDEERVRLESQVHQAQKLESLGLLAGGIAHDFNNLLVGVLSNASLALLDLDEHAPAREVVLEIERTAQRAADLTRQLLAYSGKGRFVVERVNLSELATEMSQLLRTVISKDATLQLDLDESLPEIHGDATQLRQVVMNLITNASDALHGRPGTVRIRTARSTLPRTSADTLRFGDPLPSGEIVHLEVTDSGCGMNRETAERIFDPFFSTKFTGRGLGLAATIGIVRGHHGQIAVSTAPGEGTRVSLAFPVAPALPQTAAPAGPQVTRAHRGAALVVDDDQVVRNVSAALLARRGFEVEMAANGQEALARLSAPDAAFRFVLLDLTMPGLTGVEVLERLRAEERASGRARVTVFLMSGYSEQEVSADTETLAVAGFLQKPFTLTDLDSLLTALDDDAAAA